MKILHVSPLYSPSVGGNQLHIQLMSEKLAQLGEQVHVFTSRAIFTNHFRDSDDSLNSLPQKEVINGVHVQRFNVNYRFMDFVLQRKTKIRGAYRLFRVLTSKTFEFWEHGPVAWGMLGAIRRLKPDIMLVTNHYSFTTYLCYVAKKYFKIPLVVMPIIHCADPWTKHPFLKTIYDASDALIACTEFEKKYLISFGQREDKIEVLPLGIDPEIFQDVDGKAVKQRYGLGEGPVIAYFGRKIAHKGIETLIDCMRLVWRECPDAQLLLAGQVESYFSSELTKCLDQYSDGDKRRIFNINNFGENEKGGLYAAIDIMAMPSNTDCFGIAYLEAWASGKPVIACKNTPQETIIRDGVDGLLVEYKNKEELAQAIIKLLKDDRLRLWMGDNGRQILKGKYNVNIYGSVARKVYQKLLHKQGFNNENN